MNRFILLLVGMLMACGSQTAPGVPDSKDAGGDDTQGVRISIVLHNTTSTVQYVDAWASVGVGWPVTIVAFWQSGPLALQPGESRVHEMDAPMGARLVTDSKVYTNDRRVEHSGRGFSLDLIGSGVSCELGTSGLPWPNAAAATCTTLY